MALNVRIEESRPYSRTVYIEGKLNNDTVAQFDADLEPVVNSPATVVVLDLTRLEYISSTGLRSMFRVQKAMKARGGKAVLANPTPAVKKVLEIVNAVDVTAVFSSVQELDQYLDAMQKKVTG